MDIHPDKGTQPAPLLGQDKGEEYAADKAESEGGGIYGHGINWAEEVISSSHGSSRGGGGVSVKDNNTYTHNPLHKPYTSTYQPRQQYQPHTAYNERSTRTDDRSKGQNYDRPSKKREYDSRDQGRDRDSPPDSYRDQKRYKN